MGQARQIGEPDIGQARNDQGHTVRARMRTLEGYSLSAATAFDAACRLLSVWVASHRAMSTSARMPVNLRDVSLEQP